MAVGDERFGDGREQAGEALEEVIEAESDREQACGGQAEGVVVSVCLEVGEFALIGEAFVEAGKEGGWWIVVLEKEVIGGAVSSVEVVLEGFADDLREGGEGIWREDGVEVLSELIEDVIGPQVL
jgi:hypothetical protein